MIVAKSCADLFGLLAQHKKISFDSETTGLNWQRGDYAFMWAFGIKDEELLFDLRGQSPAPFYEYFHRFLQDSSHTLIGANPKFDLHMIPELKDYQAHVHDVQVMARFLRSDRLTVGLDALAKERGLQKLDTVKEWIKKNKAYRFEKVGDNLEKIPRYDAVPEEIIYPYAAGDARLAYDLFDIYTDELHALNKYNLALNPPKDVFKALETEEKVTRVLFKMESRGVCIDEEYTRTALTVERARAVGSCKDFKEITGRDFKDSAKLFTEVFGDAGGVLESAPRTEKGSYSFTDTFLSSVKHPAAKAITTHREAHKKSRTYYTNFLELRGRNGRIHTNFRQSSTATGRLSCSDPNLQNVSTEDDSQYQVRGCFVAPEDYYMVAIDYQAQEMRLMLDLAAELKVINEVKAGKDLHQATADLLNITRKQAKNINFGILYGMGVGKLANSLGVSVEVAKVLKRRYFMSLPNVYSLVSKVTERAAKGRLANIAGRVYQFDSKFAYKGVNYLIQGSSAEITKAAMIECEKYLDDKLSKLILSVHDELVFYVHKTEVDEVVPQIAEIMKNAYVHTFLPMDVGIEIGTRWSDLESWNTYGTEKRNNL